MDHSRGALLPRVRARANAYAWRRFASHARGVCQRSPRSERSRPPRSPHQAATTPRTPRRTAPPRLHEPPYATRAATSLPPSGATSGLARADTARSGGTRGLADGAARGGSSRLDHRSALRPLGWARGGVLFESCTPAGSSGACCVSGGGVDVKHVTKPPWLTTGRTPMDDTRLRLVGFKPYLK